MVNYEETIDFVKSYREFHELFGEINSKRVKLNKSFIKMWEKSEELYKIDEKIEKEELANKFEDYIESDEDIQLLNEVIQSQNDQLLN